MSVEHWLWFCAIEFVLCLNVGPSVLLVTSHALAGDRRSATISTAGVLVANAGYFVIAAVGLAGAIAASWGGTGRSAEGVRPRILDSSGQSQFDSLFLGDSPPIC